MKFIFIAKCAVCSKGEMAELDSTPSKDGEHYPSWYAEQYLKFEERRSQLICKECTARYDSLLKEQEEVRKNFK